MRIPLHFLVCWRSYVHLRKPLANLEWDDVPVYGEDALFSSYDARLVTNCIFVGFDLDGGVYTLPSTHVGILIEDENDGTVLTVS